jgi:phosphoribosylglycinamide formyltransferase-1
LSAPVSVTPEPWLPLPAKLAVLVSGRGSNMEALAEACGSGRLAARIVTVVSDVPQAEALERARARGLRAVAIPRIDYSSRAEHEGAIRAEIRSSEADLVCLAGFMRLLSPDFCEAFSLRLLNIHPSLLPSFAGLHAQRQAIEWGARISGATVHFVDAGLDSGPIVEQVAVPVVEGDDEAALSGRILDEEHRLYARAIGRLLEGGWALEGRRIRFKM